MIGTRSKLVRLGIRAGLCVGLGLVTSVAVAWGLAAWLPHSDVGLWSVRRYDVQSSDSPIRAIDTVEYGRAGMMRRKWAAEAWGSRYYRRYEPTSRTAPEGYVPVSGPRWGDPPTVEPSRRGARSYGCEDARGWPALAMWCEFRKVPAPGGGWEWRGSGGVLLSASAQRVLEVRLLPTRPLWPGMLLNTGVYAVAWAGILLISSWMRRAFRRWRGWCGCCGYDLRGLRLGAACPECGAATGSRYQTSSSGATDEPRTQ